MSNGIFTPGIDDLGEIMRIEEACFIPGIREKRETFLDRINAFPGGFFALAADSVPLPSNAKDRQRATALAGYFCSERWPFLPESLSADWRLGHSASERHDPEGKILYVSSFAIDPLFSGQGLGRVFFREALGMILRNCAGIEQIAFIVNEEWTGARHIYETEGFADSGRLEGFFASAGNGSRRAAIIMTREE